MDHGLLPFCRRVLPEGQAALLLGHPLLGVLLLGGRCVAATVELWVLQRNVLDMIRTDAKIRSDDSRCADRAAKTRYQQAGCDLLR